MRPRRRRCWLVATADRHRVFFALWPDADIARALHSVADEACRSWGGRRTRPETLHLTLAFLGDTPTARLADAATAAAGVRCAAFEFCLDRLGYWQHNRILWAGGGSAAANPLAASLDGLLRQAGFALAERSFAAHVTLLRDCRRPDRAELPVAIRWPVRDFVLAESRPAAAGVRYEIIGRWPLV